MANSLADQLRKSGLRKRVAREMDRATKSARGGSTGARKSVESTVRELRSALDALEDRARGGSGRREAAKKAAATRKRKAAKRSAAAKKGARTRARP